MTALNEDLRIRALARLAGSRSEAAHIALSEVFGQARTTLRKSNDFDTLASALKVFETISHRFSDDAVTAIADFLQDVEGRALTHAESYEGLARDSFFEEIYGAAALVVKAIEALSRLRYLQTPSILTLLLTLACPGSSGITSMLFNSANSAMCCLEASTICSSWRRRARRVLVDNVTGSDASDVLQGMSWREFEVLVGEGFRLQGYQVVENFEPGPDDGIDLMLRKDGEKYLVQCKQWRAFKVGVPVVRELYGAMAAKGAAGGFVVTSGRFTPEAEAFASGRNLRLLDGPQLHRLLKQARGSSFAKPDDHNQTREAPNASPQAAKTAAPTCPNRTWPPILSTAAQQCPARQKWRDEGSW